MALSDADAARLVSLKAKRDALIGGGATKRITHGQRTLEMSEGDPDKLQAEIDRLEQLETSGSTRRRGALTFTLRR